MSRIAITGTKGKTTVALILDQVLRGLGHHVLKVDTTGAYIDGELKIDKDSSLNHYGLVPTRAPGRFAHLAYQQFDTYDEVLECAIGCSSITGLGYLNHDIGIFTNVYSDHLGSTKRLKTREDIARAKQFIFTQIRPGGYAVYNADDALVAGKLAVVPEGVSLVAFGLASSPAHGNGQAPRAYITVVDNALVLQIGAVQQRILDVKKVAWTFEGAFAPSIYNLLAVVAALYAYFGEDIRSQRFQEAIYQTSLPASAGRLVRLRAQNGVEILADYAHEKESLAQVARLAKTLTQGASGRLIGVVRLAWDRTDQSITETGQSIATDFDELIVYDKIDGHWRQIDPAKSITTSSGTKVSQRVGRVSGLLHDAIKSRGTPVTSILREDQAIAHAAQIAHPGDVVVVIVNDNIQRSLDFISKEFGATLV